jgi:two-component system, chemotaxis family, chemotaxis protein CheY
MSTNHNNSGQLVLIVDDDAAIREAVAELLTLEGYRTAMAANGAEALSVLAGGARPALILLDLMMPVMDGFQFRSRQQQDPKLADIPVIVFSAGRAAGAIDAAAQLPKPVDLDHLLATVAEHAAPA